MIVQVTLGISAGFMLGAVVAASAARPDRPLRIGPLALFSTTVPYAIVASAWATLGGVNLLGAALLALITVVPLLAVTATSRPVTPRGWPSMVAALGLTTLLLIAAGQTLSLLGRVNQVMAIVAVGLAGLLIGLIGGLRGAGRLGAWLFWALVVVTVIVVALALFLGTLSDLASPVVSSPGIPGVGLLFLAAGALVIGLNDPATRVFASEASPRSRVVGVIVTAGLVVVLLAGMALFYGGSFFAPSLQFFVLPANVDLIPGGLFLAMLVISMMMAAPIGNLVATLAADPDDVASPRWSLPVGGVAIAVVIAALAPGSERTAVVLALLVAAPAGALMMGRDHARAVIGLAVAVVAIIALIVTRDLEFGWPALLGLIVTVLAGALSGGRDSAHGSTADSAVQTESS